MHNRRYSHYSPRERPRTASPPEYSNLSGLERHSADSTRTYDSNASTTSTNYSRRHSPSSETLSHRSSSEPRSETLGAGYGGGMSGRSSGSRKSLTASESSLEEYYPLSELDMMTSPNISPNSQRKPKIPRQKKSLPSEERVSGVEQPTYTGVFPDSCHPPHGGMRSLPPVASSLLNIDGRSGSAGGCSSTHHHSSHHLHSSSSTLRHISSDATIHFDFSPAASPQRRRSDSPLSEYSDIRISSPPGDSMSPCSPEYNRSPRQSGDSDLLNVNLRKRNPFVYISTFLYIYSTFYIFRIHWRRGYEVNNRDSQTPASFISSLGHMMFLFFNVSSSSSLQGMSSSSSNTCLCT